MALSAALLLSTAAILIKKYRSGLGKLVLLCGLLFISLLVVDSVIQLSIVRFENDPHPDAFVIDYHPFPSLVMFSVNWQLPGMLVVVLCALIMIKNIGRTIYFWVGLALAGVSICGFILLAHHVCSFHMGSTLHEATWWL